MDFGYVRVSAKDQNPARQVKIMLELGIEERNIYVEKKSGHTFNRETYDMLVNHIMRPGDKLVVTELKRFGRNYKEIYREWQHITKECGMDIKVVDMPILDTSVNKDLLGQVITDVVLSLLAYVAEGDWE
jgi:DNA invertase Pin-like site-specific DNA recombinase